MPNKFEEGILYMSKEFGIAIHLCACGCGNKVMTPIGKVEWTIKNKKMGVSMWPSIGNGQLPCKSHYIIRNGQIIWCPPMDDEETMRHLQEASNRRNNYYRNLKQPILLRFRTQFKTMLHKLFSISKNKTKN